VYQCNLSIQSLVTALFHLDVHLQRLHLRHADVAAHGENSWDEDEAYDECQ